MANKVTVVASMPNADCPACHGIGAIPMTAHFAVGPNDFELPCWVCFSNVKLLLPIPAALEN